MTIVAGGWWRLLGQQLALPELPSCPSRERDVDAASAAEAFDASVGGENLPGGHDTADDLRRVFGRMGFNDREIVALSGDYASFSISVEISLAQKTTTLSSF